jgi:hypothetical protein
MVLKQIKLANVKHWMSRHFTRRHVVILAVLWLVFTAWTFLIVSSGLDHAREQLWTVVTVTAASVLGPMTGAISRGFQGCCLQASLSLLPYCFSGLAVGTLTQVVWHPQAMWLRVVRLAIWASGIFVWFAGGIISFFHALS